MATKRPGYKENYKSFVVNWRGNVPVIQPTTWEPGYTEGHQATEQEAVAMEIAHLLQHLADFREKWLQINVLAEQLNVPTEPDTFGRMVSVTETDDPHEEMTMPDGAVDVVEAEAARVNAEQYDDMTFDDLLDTVEPETTTDDALNQQLDDEFYGSR